jgi:hypothetical protein
LHSVLEKFRETTGPEYSRTIQNRKIRAFVSGLLLSVVPDHYHLMPVPVKGKGGHEDPRTGTDKDCLHDAAPDIR